MLNLFYSCVLISASLLQVGSQSVRPESNYSYQNQYQEFNDRSRPASRRQYPQRITNKNGFDGVDVNYPVRTVQKFTDRDGNIKVVTSYSNSAESTLPIYRDEPLRIATPLKRKFEYEGYHHPPPVIPQPRLPVTQQYARARTIRFPGNEGQLLTNKFETKTRGGNSSAYKRQSPYNRKSKKPESRLSDSHSRGRDIQPLQSASSSFVPDIDDEPGECFGDGDYYQKSGYKNHGHMSSYKPHGLIFPHGHVVHFTPHGGGFSKENGNSYSHSQKEEKGDSGGKGHKSHEVYHKGHSEKHGHEENKGGHVEESGEKTGHHDEENHYAKGHTSSSGQKGSENEHVKGHKKGHKTKGFRTVHHKDEYKKDEIFYDEEHDAGNQKHHGNDQTENSQAEGGKSKKGHLNSGYKDAQKGHHGDKEEGHSYETAKGQSGQEGHNSHHSHSSHYDQGSEHGEGELHGGREFPSFG